MKPEERARHDIDKQLKKANCLIQTDQARLFTIV